MAESKDRVIEHYYEARDFDPKPVPSCVPKEDKKGDGTINYDVDTMEGIRNSCDRVRRRFLLLRKKFPDETDNSLALIILAKDGVGRKLFDSKPITFRMCVDRDCVEKKDEDGKDTVDHLLNLTECRNLGIISDEDGQKAFRDSLSKIYVKPHEPRRIKKKTQ